MNRNAWIVFSVICVAILGGLIWSSNNNKLDVSGVDIQSVLAATEDSGNIGDHVFGNRDAKVKIIEYGDFQCPGCGSAAPILKEVSHKYSKDVAFIFRNFPLTSIHPNARAAAAAAEAAGLQGKYWEMHDKLYENQSEWSNSSGTTRTDIFANYAASLGLDKTKFNNDLSAETIAKKIDFDAALGDKAGVSSTPGIFVNGKTVDQSVKDGKLVPSNNTDPLVWTSAEDFEKLIILPALKEAGVEVAN